MNGQFDASGTWSELLIQLLLQIGFSFLILRLACVDIDGLLRRLSIIELILKVVVKAILLYPVLKHLFECWCLRS